MGLRDWKITLTSKGRHQKQRAQSSLGFFTEETPPPDDNPQSNTAKLEEAMSVLRILQQNRADKKPQLPLIPHLRSITMSNLLMSDEQRRDFSANSSGSSNYPSAEKAIKRKPVPQRWLSTMVCRSSSLAKFDPQTPRQNPEMHVRAKEALKRRYQSKITVDFEVPKGLSARDYDFRWVDPEEMDRKIMEDLIWVRERFCQSGREEPTDVEIIWWYDAGKFDNEGGSLSGGGSSLDNESSLVNGSNQDTTL